MQTLQNFPKSLHQCRIIKTTPFKRFLLALIPLAVIDIILLPISLFEGSPTFLGVLMVNFVVILILALRFSVLFFCRMWCPTCGKGLAEDTGRDDQGYPVVKCSRCGRQWIL